MKKRINNIEKKGINAFRTLITDEFEWITREQSESDVGVDFHIECVDAYGNPNGLLIGVQIKSGLGNVHESKNHFIRYVNNEHFHYWLKINIPMIMILYDPKSDSIYWEKINKETLTPTKKNYKIIIPKKNKLKEKKSLEKFGNLNTELSDINSLIQNIDAAQIVFKNSIEFNPNNTDALNQYSLILTENNFFKESMSLLNKAYKIDKRNSVNGISEKTITRKLNFCQNLLLLGKLNCTLKIIKKCDLEAKKTLKPSNYLFSVIQNFYGQINRQKGKINQAITNCKNAIVHSKENENDYEFVISLSNLSEMYVEKSVRNNYNKELLFKALNLQFDAFRLSKTNEKHVDRIDFILSKIGVIYYYLKDFKKSVEYYQDSLKIQIEKFGENNIRIANRYNNLANSLSKINKMDEAIEYNSKAITININIYETENHYEIANLYFNRGMLELRRKQFDKATIFLEKWESILVIIDSSINRFLPTLNKACKETGFKYKIKTANKKYS